MTEASKARKRHPLRIIRGPATNESERARTLEALRTMRSTIVLPPETTYEVVRPRKSTPAQVTTTGVRAVTGVGNRRRCARQRRARRRRRSAAEAGRWVVFDSPGGPMSMFQEAQQRAMEAISAALMGSAMAPRQAAEAPYRSMFMEARSQWIDRYGDPKLE